MPLGYCVTEVKKKNTGGREENLLSLSYGNIIRRDIATADGLLPESFDSYNVICPGDTVLRLTDLQNDQRSLRVGLVEEVGIITSAYVTIRPSKVMHPKFLNYFLKHMDFRKDFYALGAGVRQSLKFDELRSVKLPVPPLAEQKVIADYLDRETARIEALIEKSQLVINCLEERWRNDIRLKMNELFAAHGAIPLKRLVECLDGSRVPLSSTDRELRKGPYPYFGASTVVDHIDDYLYDEQIVLLGEDGGQLVEPNFLISQVVDEKCWVNNHAHVLRPVNVDPHFLSMHLNTFARDLYISGATRPKITQDDMGRIPVPNIGMRAQIEITNELTQRTDRVSRIINATNRRIDLLFERRQALITASVTGDLEIQEVAA
jgi:type I restriction enzyme S subunit